MQEKKKMEDAIVAHALYLKYLCLKSAYNSPHIDIKCDCEPGAFFCC